MSFYQAIESIFNGSQIVFGYILSLGMSIATIILGGWMLKDFILKKMLCIRETEAEVIGYKEDTSHMRDSDGDRWRDKDETSYFCKYRYYIGGRSFVNTSEIGESSPIFKIGSRVTLRYNPKKPSQHYIVGSNFSVTMVFGGVFFIIMGVIFLIFVCIGISQGMNGLF